MPDLSIKTMTIIDAPKNAGGTRVLAAYDLDFHGVRIRGCIITEDADGIVTAKGLMGKTNKNDKISVQFVDPATERAITRKAADAYTALTGKELNHE